MLDGYVRQWTRGKETLYLVYEAYEAIPLPEMRKLSVRAREQFDIAHIGIVHWVGKLEVGETSVGITVAAPHRKAALAACEWLIRELKRTVPIWKKEFYADGSGWVEGGNTIPVANTDDSTLGADHYVARLDDGVNRFADG